MRNRARGAVSGTTMASLPSRPARRGSHVLLGAAAAAGLLGGLADRASAMCGTPAWLGTAPAVEVPERGVLYAASADDALASLALEGAPATWRVERVDGPDGFDVVALHYEARDGAVLDVGPGGGAGGAGLRVSEAWSAPAASPRVVSLGRSRHAWSCSQEDAVAVQVDQPVAAFRVRWFAGGAWSEAIVPPMASDQAPSTPVLLLGKVDCAGETVPVDVLVAGAVVDVTAIRLDGSEVAVDGLPPVVDLDDLPPFTEITYVDPHRAMVLAGVINAVEVGPTLGPARPRGPRTGAIALGLVGVAALFGLARGRALAAATGRARLPVAMLRR